jgi:hypothetical protein
LAAFVIDINGGGLATSAIGWLDQHLIGAGPLTLRLPD